jgi:translation initiation factor 6
MSQKHISILNFHGDPNIGLHGMATDTYCLIGKCATDKQVAELESVLKVPVFRVTIYGTDLVGLFAIGNSSTLLIPKIIFENELKALKSQLEKINIKVEVIDTEHTAFGNNILLTDQIAIISSEFNPASQKQLHDVLKIKPIVMDIANAPIPGSVGKITNKGAIFSPNLSEGDILKIEKLLGYEIGLGTINLGNPFVSSGIIANSFGFVIGQQSSGFEISRVDESLRFI